MSREVQMVLNGREQEGMARIKVVGAGGGGSKAVSRMYRARIAVAGSYYK